MFDAVEAPMSTVQSSTLGASKTALSSGRSRPVDSLITVLATECRKVGGPELTDFALSRGASDTWQTSEAASFTVSAKHGCSGPSA